MNRMKLIYAMLLIVTMTILVPFDAVAADKPVKLVGVYKTIDISQQQKLMNELASVDVAVRQPAMAFVQKNPGKVTPPVLMAFGNVLVNDGRTEEGVLWIMAGHLRAQYDVLRATDPTTRRVMEKLYESYAIPVRQFITGNSTKVPALIQKVTSWDKTVPYGYDPRWIVLNADMAQLVSMGKAKEGPLTKPQNVWSKLYKRAVKRFTENYYRILERTKEGKTHGTQIVPPVTK